MLRTLKLHDVIYVNLEKDLPLKPLRPWNDEMQISALPLLFMCSECGGTRVDISRKY